MRILKNILAIGFLILIGTFLWLSPFQNEFMEGNGRLDGTPHSYFSNQYSFSSGGASLGGGCATLDSGNSNNSLQTRITTGSGFLASLLEKILSYSPFREKFMSNVTTKPFPHYVLHISDTPGSYYVFALREIII